MGSKQISIYRCEVFPLNAVYNTAEVPNHDFAISKIIYKTRSFWDFHFIWNEERRIVNIVSEQGEIGETIFVVKREAFVRFYFTTGIIISYGLGRKISAFAEYILQLTHQSISPQKAQLKITSLLNKYSKISTLLPTLQKIRVSNIAIESIPCAKVDIEECSISELETFLLNTNAIIEKLTVFFSNGEYPAIKLSSLGRIAIVTASEWEWDAAISFLQKFLNESNIMEK